MFAAQFARNERTNFCADEFSWACGLANDLNKDRFSIYDGIAGDVLSAGLFLDRDPDKLYENGRLSELADKLTAGAKHVTRFLSPDAKRRFSLQAATSRLEAELVKFQHLHNPLTQFYFWNRTRREISLFPFGILSHRHEVHAPFLDRALVEFLLSLPTAMTGDKQLHTETIVETYPAYSDIPFEDKGLKGRPRYGPTFLSAAKLLLYILSSPFRGEFDLTKLSRSCLGMARSGMFGGQAAKTLYLNQLLLRITDAGRARAS